MANFTPQEIEQFLQEFFDVVGARQYVGARDVPIFGRAGEDTVEWDSLAPYEPLTVVMHEGISYVSRRYVPRGINISNTDYWAQTYRFNAQVEQYRLQVMSFDERISRNTEAIAQESESRINADAQVLADARELFTPYPDGTVNPKYGDAGQVLSSLGDGSTRWEDPVIVTSEIAGPIIADWLDDHPEATTTIEDGAVTTAKIANGAVTDEKLDPSGITARVAKISHDLSTTETLVLTTEHGWINRYNGSFSPSDAYIASGFIRVYAGTTYSITASRDPANAYDTAFCVYDTAKAFVRATSQASYVDSPFTATDDGFIRVTSFGSTPPVVTTEGISAFNFIDANTDGIADLGAFVNGTLSTSGDVVFFTADGWLNRYDGSLSPDGTTITSDYVRVLPGNSYYITGSRDTSNQYSSAFVVYDEAKAFVRASATNAFNQTLFAPTEPGYIRVSSVSGSSPIVTCVGISVRNEIDKFNALLGPVGQTVKRLEGVANTLPLAGKRILWLGTSIPAGNQGAVVTIDDVQYVNAYPNMIAQLLGCSVINNAIGTSTARTGEASRVSADDPMGIGYLHWQIATRCLTQTIAEKQSIIDDWDTKWGPNGTLHLYGAPATLSDDAKATILRSSYENLLTPYLDGTNAMPDLFVIDHGWNDGSFYDATTGDQMAEIPTDPYDRHYFTGAMNLVTRMILEANPRARIVLIGHYTDQQRPWVANAQAAVSAYWDRSLLKLWERSGISVREITYEGQTTTVLNVYCPDTLHPHSDTTGQTNYMLANVIGRWLMTEA